MACRGFYWVVCLAVVAEVAASAAEVVVVVLEEEVSGASAAVAAAAAAPVEVGKDKFIYRNNNRIPDRDYRFGILC